MGAAHLGQAREVALHVGEKDRNAGVRKSFGQDLQRNGLAGTGRTGDQPLEVIVEGDGAYVLQPIDALEKAGLAASAWLPGSRNDIPELMRSFDLFVINSIADIQFLERSGGVPGYDGCAGVGSVATCMTAAASSLL